MPQPADWYVLRVRGRCEKLVSSALQQKGYETFLPMVRLRPDGSPRSAAGEAPLFPGYVFSRFDVDHRLPILVTPGVDYVVGIGKTPAPVPAQEVESIRKVVASTLPAERWPRLAEGDRVTIERGPLAGVTGTIVRRDRKEQLVVSITLLQRSVAVCVDRFSVCAAR